jgi:hypothetical protein
VAGGEWRYAAVLAGVLLTGAIVFRMMDFGQTPAATEMAGTLVSPHAAVTVDMVQLSPGAVSGRVSLIRDGAELGVALELTAGAPVDVLIASEGHSMRVNGLGSQAARCNDGRRSPYLGLGWRAAGAFDVFDRGL